MDVKAYSEDSLHSLPISRSPDPPISRCPDDLTPLSKPFKIDEYFPSQAPVFVWRLIQCRSGGIGRRAWFRSDVLARVWGFESLLRHQVKHIFFNKNGRYRPSKGLPNPLHIVPAIALHCGPWTCYLSPKPNAPGSTGLLPCSNPARKTNCLSRAQEAKEQGQPCQQGILGPRKAGGNEPPHQGAECQEE